MTYLTCTNFTYGPFVTLFSGTVRPKKLKHSTHNDSGLVYCVYRIWVAGAYSSLYFFIFISLQFTNNKKSCHTFSGNMLHTMAVEWCNVYTRVGLLVLICRFISSFFFLSNFQTLKMFFTFFAVKT